VFATSAQAPIKAINSVASNNKKIVQPILASIPAVGAWAESQIYRTIAWGGDPVNAAMMGRALATASDFVAQKAAAGLSYAPEATGAAFDAALMYGVYQEGRAMASGKCTP